GAWWPGTPRPTARARVHGWWRASSCWPTSCIRGSCPACLLAPKRWRWRRCPPPSERPTGSEPSSGDAAARGAGRGYPREHRDSAQRQTGDEAEHRNAALIGRADRKASQEATDQATDVGPHGDVGEGEAEDQVDHDQPADP